MNKNTKFIAFIPFIIILVVICGSLWFMFQPKEHYLQGQIEAKQVSVASKIPGRVDKILVKEGDEITKGNILLKISTPEINAKLEQANAAKDVALAQLKKANNGARKQQIEGAYRLYLQAKTAADFAKTSFERVESLYKDSLVPAQKRDEVFMKYNVATERMKVAESQWKMAKEGARGEDKLAAQALVDRAQGAVDEVTSYKNEGNLYAPISAEVLKIIPNEGELVNTGFPIVTLIDLKDIWLVLNVREDMMQNFSKGKTFVGKIPALGNKEYNFKVKSVSVLADFATWTATKASGDFDRKTFEIKAYPTEKIENLRPGMSVLVKR